MSDRTAAELEQDAELARARVADTAESIRNKMTPGQLIDEFSGLLTGSDGTSALSTLKSQVSQNPLAVSLVGAGVAWLMLGNNVSSKTSNESNGARVQKWSGAEAVTPRSSPHADTPPLDYGATPSIADRVSRVSDAMSAMAGDGIDAVKEAATSAKSRLSSATTSAATSAASTGSSGLQAAQNVLSAEPLVLAALGLAIGTAIGAMLPHSAIEDEQLGPLSAQLKEKATDAVNQGIDEAKDVAAQAYQSVKDAADEQFSKDDDGGGTLVEKAAAVVRSAATETEVKIREKLPE